jgi:selenide,water dikinase
VGLVIESERVPQLPGAFDYASMGLVPAGSWANQNFCARSLKIAEGVSPVLVNVLADAQTSGGLLLAVPDDRVDGFLAEIRAGDAPGAVVIGRVTEGPPGTIAVV